MRGQSGQAGRHVLTDLGTRHRQDRPGWQCSPRSVRCRRHPRSGPAAPPGLPGKQDGGENGKQNKNRTNQKHNETPEQQRRFSSAPPLTGNTWAEPQAPKPLSWWQHESLSPGQHGALRKPRGGRRISCWPITKSLPCPKALETNQATYLPVPAVPLSFLYSITCLPQSCFKQEYNFCFSLPLFSKSL